MKKPRDMEKKSLKRKRATCVVHLNSCKLIKLKYGQAEGVSEGDGDTHTRKRWQYMGWWGVEREGASVY